MLWMKLKNGGKCFDRKLLSMEKTFATDDTDTHGYRGEETNKLWHNLLVIFLTKNSNTLQSHRHCFATIHTNYERFF
jgi:hypothetical protein